MSCRWGFWLRFLISVLLVLVLYWPFSRFTWWSFGVQGPSVATGGNPIHVVAPVAGVSRILCFVAGPFGIAVGEAVIASLAAITIFTGLTYLGDNRRERESRCRKCRHVLRGLTEPQCPSCGEPL